MPDEVSAEDTVHTDAQSQQETGQVAPSNEDTADETELIFGKYKDMEDAAKHEAEREKLFGKQAAELGDLRKQVESLKSQADQASAIKELVEALKPKEEPAAPEWGAIEQDFINRGWDEDDAKRQVEVMKVTAAWQQQGEEQVRSSVLSEVEQLKAQLAEEREARVKLTDDYRENKEMIDQLTSGGMQLNAAIQFAKTISEKLPASAPGRQSPPPSVQNGRVATQTEKPKEVLSPEDKVAIAGGLGSTVEALEADGTFARMIAEHNAKNGGN